MTAVSHHAGCLCCWTLIIVTGALQLQKKEQFQELLATEGEGMVHMARLFPSRRENILRIAFSLQERKRTEDSKSFTYKYYLIVWLRKTFGVSRVKSLRNSKATVVLKP